MWSSHAVLGAQKTRKKKKKDAIPASKTLLSSFTCHTDENIVEWGKKVKPYNNKLTQFIGIFHVSC